MSTLSLHPEPSETSDLEFGSAPLDRPVELMRTGRDREGKLAMVGETPGTEHRTARCCRWTDRTGKERFSAWWELRVSVDAREQTVIAGHSLALVEFPWSRAQVDVATFKRASKKGAAERPEPPDRVLEDDVALMNWIAALPNDFWEKGNRLSAAISRPTPLQDGGTTLRAARKPLLVFGVCEENPDDCAAELSGSKEAADLLRRLEDDNLAFWARAAVRDMKTLPKGAYPEVKEMGQTLIRLAAKLALAGPVAHSAFWTGKPVMKLADAIFRNLVNLHNRRAHSRHTREDTASATDAAEQAEWAPMEDWLEEV